MKCPVSCERIRTEGADQFLQVPRTLNVPQFLFRPRLPPGDVQTGRLGGVRLAVEELVQVFDVSPP